VSWLRLMNSSTLPGDIAATNPVDLRSLPYRTRLIAEKIGLDKTFILLSVHAHETLYIPGTLKHSDLANKVGKNEAKALIELWPEQTITLPKVDKLFQQWRNHEIVTAMHEGETAVIDLCRRWNLTRQRISQLMKEYHQKKQESTKTQHENLTLDLSL